MSGTTIEAIRAIEDWDLRAKVARKELKAALEPPPQVARALELVAVLADLAVGFAGDGLYPKASRLKAGCRDAVIALERAANDPETRERVALGRLALEREAASLPILEHRLAAARRSLDAPSAGAQAVLDGVEAHCAWERGDQGPAVAMMLRAFEQLEPEATLAPARWLGELSWQAGRLTYWFDMAEDDDAELAWRRKTIALLEQEMAQSPSVRGLLGLHQESLGALLVKRGEVTEGIAALTSAFERTAGWSDAQRRIAAQLDHARASNES